MAATRFFLIRHAHAHWTPDEMRPLSDRGRVDAERVAELLAPESPAAVYSSPYPRARATVEPLAKSLGMPVVEKANLRERELGVGWQKDFEATVRRTWDDFSFAYRGGETNAAAQQRAEAVYHDLRRCHGGQSVVLATHGNLLVLLLNRLDPDVGFEFWRSLTLPDIYRLDAGSEGLIELQRVWQPSGRLRDKAS